MWNDDTFGGSSIKIWLDYCVLYDSLWTWPNIDCILNAANFFFNWQKLNCHWFIGQCELILYCEFVEPNNNAECSVINKNLTASHFDEANLIIDLFFFHWSARLRKQCLWHSIISANDEKLIKSQQPRHNQNWSKHVEGP